MKKGNFFTRHKILTVFLVLIVLGIIGSAIGNNDDTTKKAEKPATTKAPTSVKDKKEDKPTVTPEPEVKTYSNGTYLVNEDIQSGMYKATLTDTLTKTGYIERSSDVNMELDSIIANIILTGDGYVEIKDTDVAVKLQGVKIQPINLKDLKPNIKKEASDGIYLIGYDLAPGTYKVEVTDKTTGMGYVERAKSVAMGMDDIIANEIIQGNGYVKIEKSDFAVRLQGVKITLKK